MEKAIKTKWREATCGPPCHPKELLEGTDQGFRQRLLKAQGECRELKPLIEASRILLGATQKESVKEAEATAKDYENRGRSARKGCSHYQSESMGSRDAYYGSASGMFGRS